MQAFQTLQSVTSKGRYLDHNATTPLAQRVADKVPEWLQLWGNPSSIHWSGRGPKTLLREARRHLSRFLDCDPLELVFTSGGTEATNLALQGLFELHLQRLGADPNRWPRSELIISSVEHPATMMVAERLEAKGLKVHRIRVNRQGVFDLEQFESALNERTLLVSVMFANNETGQLLPLKEITQLSHAVGALVHCDMVQALGKSIFSLKEIEVDYASFSAHKFYALKGCGVLFVKRGSPFLEQILGGRQERRRRGGTENTLSIASFGEMAQVSRAELEHRIASVTALRDQLEASLVEQIEDLEILCQSSARIGNTTSVLVKGCDGESLLMNLDLQGFAVSTGAACSSGSPEPSPVLRAMGLSRAEAQQSLRLSLGWGTQQQEIEGFVEAFKYSVARLRKISEGR